MPRTLDGRASITDGVILKTRSGYRILERGGGVRVTVKS